ncbi:hypothetical protein [Pseudothauera lacus]|uniref:Uncharacterized protein n=1 Tax=Pseudothauera lacus TaxID=2136175 RepID=A0A2T4IJX9_9RHOO|nr:hypothetical protein [Pseudothauera lacus]PTD98079.1 hypothetical protein C8261_01285 [Pseudothauera lacus]
MKTTGKPARWKDSDDALRAVQVAFDVEARVLEAVRRAAFENNLSMPDQVRNLLGLPVTHRPKRPRLTVSLTPADYQMLAARYGLPADDLLAIKERAAGELIDFADDQ